MIDGDDDDVTWYSCDRVTAHRLQRHHMAVRLRMLYCKNK